uniref:Tropomyosin-2 n=1 Tax=Caenorhabditis tropicalis TaxID=1561998 RepID=A0A1I7UGH2_9PELO
MGVFGEDEIELKERLKKERYEKLLELKGKSEKNLLELEDHFSKKCKTESEEMAEKMKEEIKAVREATEEQLKNIEKLIKEENGEHLEQVGAMLRKADEALELEIKKLKENISETLKKNDERIEEANKSLKETEEKCEEVRRQNQHAEFLGPIEVEKHRRKLVSDEQDAERERFEAVIKLKAENSETKSILAVELAEKQKEDDKELEKYRGDVVEYEVKTMKKLVNLKKAEINRDSMNVLHDHVGELQRMNMRFETLTSECELYFCDGFEWNGQTRGEGKRSFDDIKSYLGSIKEHLLSTERSISDIEENEVRVKKQDEIKSLNQLVSQSHSCLIPFISQFRCGKTSWSKDNETNFREAMSKITRAINEIRLPQTGDAQFQKQITADNE